MSIEFRCECGELFQVEDEFAGRKGRCPTCKRIMLVPEKELEPLELQEEIREEPELFEPDPPRGIVEPPPEPPAARRVEEDVEVLRGWDGPEPDLDRMDRSAPAPRTRSWQVIPRPVLLGVPAALIGILLIFVLLRPSGHRAEHPALERASAPRATEGQKPAPLPEPQVPPQAPSELAPSPPRVEVSPAPARPGPAAVQTEKQGPAQASPTAQPRTEDRRGATTVAPSQVSPPKDSRSGRDTRPKEGVTKAQPQAAAPPRAPSPAAENYTVNVGAFKSQRMAEAYAEVLRKRGLDPFVWSTNLKKGQGKMYRVSIGRFSTKRQADMYAKELKDKHGLSTYVAKKPRS